MLDMYTIVSKAEHIARLCGVFRNFSYDLAYQARPEMVLPVTIKDGKRNKMIMARWGGELPPTISTKRILAGPYGTLFRKQRCAVPANCFFGMNGEHPHLVRLIQPRLFLMGGLFIETKDEYQFTLLQCGPADIPLFLVKMPITFKPEDLYAWMHADHLESAMVFADKAGSHWFDFFRVSEDILDPKMNNLELLNPIGLSFQQIHDREQKLKAIEFEQDRPNRSSMKHR